MSEFNELVKFAGQPPIVDIQKPDCMSVSLLEMKFSHDLLPTLVANDKESVSRRFGYICANGCQGLMTTEEIKVWQTELINEALLKIVCCDSTLAPAIAKVVDMLMCFLSPLPHGGEMRIFLWTQDLPCA